MSMICSYNDIPFCVDHTITNKQWHQDVGRNMRFFTVAQSEREMNIDFFLVGENYLENKVRLLKELDTGKSGILKHPQWGEWKVSCAGYTINEAWSQRGVVKGSIRFKEQKVIAPLKITKHEAPPRKIEGTDSFNKIDKSDLEKLTLYFAKALDMFKSFEDAGVVASSFAYAIRDFKAQVFDFANRPLRVMQMFLNVLGLFKETNINPVTVFSKYGELSQDFNRIFGLDNRTENEAVALVYSSILTSQVDILKQVCEGDGIVNEGGSDVLSLERECRIRMLGGNLVK